MDNSPVKRAYSRYPDGLTVGPQCIVPKRRVVGLFNTKLKRVRIMVDKLKAEDKVVDVSSTSAVKSMILLDTGVAVLSSLTVRVLYNDYRKNEKLPSENPTEQDTDSGT